MKLYTNPAADRRINSPTVFRCNACAVRFQPTRTETSHCPRCAAGRRLYHSIRLYQRVTP